MKEKKDRVSLHSLTLSKLKKRLNKEGSREESQGSSGSSEQAEIMERRRLTTPVQAKEFHDELVVKRQNLNLTKSGLQITKKGLQDLRSTAELIFKDILEENPRLTELLTIDEEKESQEVEILESQVLDSHQEPL